MWEPQLSEDEKLTRSTLIGQALGAASTCWEDMSGTGIFDDAKAVDILNGVLHQLEVIDKPNLGMATNRELLAELSARAELGGYAEYRTYDDHL